jgi:hypothetical protein
MLAGLNFDDSDYVPWILQIDTGGHILSSRVVKEPEYPGWTDFSILKNGSIVLVGYQNLLLNDTMSYCTPSNDEDDFIVAEADSSYQFQWCTLNGGLAGGRLNYVCTINDSLIVAAGVSQSNDGDLSRCSSFPTEYTNSWLGLYNLNQHAKVWDEAICGGTLGDEINGLYYDSAENAVYVLVNSSSDEGDFTGLGFPNSENMYLLKYSPVTTGIESLEPNILQFSIFPNPANEYVNISTTGINGPLNLKLMDLMGHAIAVYKFQQPEYQIPVSSLAEGMYLISVSDNEGRVGVRKFVKSP